MKGDIFLLDGTLIVDGKEIEERYREREKRKSFRKNEMGGKEKENGRVKKGSGKGNLRVCNGVGNLFSFRYLYFAR